MTNFEVELHSLVSEWLRRGDDPESMRAALRDQIERLHDRAISGFSSQPME